MARLSANGEEVVRLEKTGEGNGRVQLSFRSNRQVLKKIRQGTYDSGWKRWKRFDDISSMQTTIGELKGSGWKEVKR